MRALLIFSAIINAFSFSASALTLEKIEVPEQVAIGENTLILNGTGLRIAERFGLRFKVHISALYAPAKTTDANVLLDSTSLRMIRSTFLRRVSSKDITEPFAAGIIANCLALLDKTKCEAVRQAMKPLIDKFPDMLDGSTTQYQFYPDRVDFEIKGRKELKGTLVGADISKCLLAYTIGPKPASEDLKKGLLGLLGK